MLGESIENVIKNVVIDTLNKSKESKLPDDIISTDNLGEIIEKLSILHCRMWYLEDKIGESNDDTEIADLKRKIDICFKIKRPKYVEAINRLVQYSIDRNKSLIEDSVKIYNGFEQKEEIKNIIPPPPKPPLNRVVREKCTRFCNNCGSTMSKNGFLGIFGEILCHNSECPNSKSIKMWNKEMEKCKDIVYFIENYCKVQMNKIILTELQKSKIRKLNVDNFKKQLKK